MDWFYKVAIAVAVVLALRIATARKRQTRQTILFRQRETLFTAAERSFLGVLDQALAGRYGVFCKVRIADAITPANGLDKST